MTVPNLFHGLFFTNEILMSLVPGGSLWVKRSLGSAEGPAEGSTTTAEWAAAPTEPAPTTTIELEPQFIEAVKTYKWELAEKLVSSEQDRQDLANSRARVEWMAKHISDGDVQRAKSLAITEAEVERIEQQAMGSHGEQVGGRQPSGPHSGVSPELRRRVLELDRVSDALVEAKMTVAQYALELEEARQQLKALKGRTTSAKAEEELQHVRAALAKAEAAHGEALAGRTHAEAECERLRSALAATTNDAAATARTVASGPRVALTASSAPSPAFSNRKGVRVESPLHPPFHKGLSFQLTEVHDYHYFGFATSNIAALNGGNYTVTLGGASSHGTLRTKHFETRGHLSPRMRFESGKAVTRRQPLKPPLSKSPLEPGSRLTNLGAPSSGPPSCDGKVADADADAGNAAAGSDATAAGTSRGTSRLVGSHAPLMTRQLAPPKAKLPGEPKPLEPPEPSAWSAFEAMLAQDGAHSFAFVYPLPRVLDKPRLLDEPRVLDEPASPADDESPIPADGVPGSRSDADALLLFGGFCVWDASGNILKVHALTDEQPLATALAQPLEAGDDAPVAGRAPGSPILGTPRLHFNRSEDKDERGQPLLPQALRQYLYEIHRVIAC